MNDSGTLSGILSGSGMNYMHKIQFKFQKSLSFLGFDPGPPREVCFWTQLEDFRSSDHFYNYVHPLVQFLNTPLRTTEGALHSGVGLTSNQEKKKFLCILISTDTAAE